MDGSLKSFGQHFERNRFPQARLRPRADSNADAATIVHGEVGNALVEVNVPFFGAANHLPVVKDRLRRAIGDADLTSSAEVVDADIDRRVVGQRHVGQHRRQAKV